MSLQKIGGVIVSSLAKFMGVSLSAGGSGIVRVQTVSGTIDNAQSTADFTIPNSITPSQSFILFNGSTCYEYKPFNQRATVEILNSTTVRATRHGSQTALYVHCCIAELGNGITSLQRGTITLPADVGAGSQSVAESISQVNMANTFLTWSERGNQGSTNGVDAPARLYLNSPTELIANRIAQYKNGDWFVAYEAIELDL